MTIEETGLAGCLILQPEVFEDDRGYFYESYNEATFYKATGYKCQFIQDNQSRSKYGVIRGLHLQMGEYSQAKLVRVLEGEILDVVVDLRTDSSTFGQHFSLSITEKNKKQLFIPKGFTHGFAVLSNMATIHYKEDNYYNPAAESGLYYADPELGIDWKVAPQDIMISDKDKRLPTFHDFKTSILHVT